MTGGRPIDGGRPSGSESPEDTSSLNSSAQLEETPPDRGPMEPFPLSSDLACACDERGMMSTRVETTCGRARSRKRPSL